MTRCLLVRSLPLPRLEPCSVHDCVSNHGPVPRIVTFEKDGRTVGSTTVAPELLDMRYVDDVQRAILLESFQRNDLRAGSPADTP
jgi:hypothetical protein